MAGIHERRRYMGGNMERSHFRGTGSEWMGGRFGRMEGGVENARQGGASGHAVNVRGRVVLGTLLGFFGTLAVVGLLVNGFRSSVPYASCLAFVTLAMCGKRLVGESSRSSRRSDFGHRRFTASLSAGNGRLVASERVQYSRLNQRLSLVDRDFSPADYDLLLELDNNNQRFRRFLEGASKGVLDRLPTYVYRAQQGGATPKSPSGSSFADVSETKTGCTICLEDFCTGDRVRILPCFHQFHIDCVDRWLYQQAKCPVCKYMVVDVQIPEEVLTESLFESQGAAC